MNGWAEGLQQEIILWLPKLGMALAILFAFWLCSKAINAAFLKLGNRLGLREPLPSLIGRVASLTIVVLGIITALGTLGIDVTALVAGLGLTGFALGFALKDSVSNLLAGVLILAYRPFEMGNYIRVAGHEGEVVKIDLRYTTLENEENTYLIPNSLIFSNAVTIVNR